MTDFDKWAADRICSHEAARCGRCDAAVNVLAAVGLGVAAALALAHWLGLLLP